MSNRVIDPGVSIKTYDILNCVRKIIDFHLTQKGNLGLILFLNHSIALIFTTLSSSDINKPMSKKRRFLLRERVRKQKPYS